MSLVDDYVTERPPRTQADLDAELVLLRRVWEAADRLLGDVIPVGGNCIGCSAYPDEGEEHGGGCSVPAMREALDALPWSPRWVTRGA